MSNVGMDCGVQGRGDDLEECVDECYSLFASGARALRRREERPSVRGAESGDTGRGETRARSCADVKRKEVSTPTSE